MHELSIVQNLVSLAEDELRRDGYFGPVNSLTIKVGILSGAHPDAIRFAFEVISKNSRLDNADLKIISVEPILNCRECGKSSEINEILFQCPLCGSQDFSITGGDDLSLESIELDGS